MKTLKQIQLDILARGADRLYRAGRPAEAFDYAREWHLLNASR